MSIVSDNTYLRALLAVLCLVFALPAFAQDAKPPAAVPAASSDEIIYRTNLGRADDVVLLIKQGASANAVDSHGTPLLSLAAARKDKEGINVVKALLQNGAALNGKDASGQTALFYAAKQANINTIDFLLYSGIDYYATDNGGDIARTIAHREGHEDVVAVLDNFVKSQTAKVAKQYEDANKALAERYKQMQNPQQAAPQAPAKPVVAPLAAPQAPSVTPPNVVPPSAPATPQAAAPAAPVVAPAPQASAQPPVVTPPTTAAPLPQTPAAQPARPAVPAQVPQIAQPAVVPASQAQVPVVAPQVVATPAVQAPAAAVPAQVPPLTPTAVPISQTQVSVVTPQVVTATQTPPAPPAQPPGAAPVPAAPATPPVAAVPITPATQTPLPAQPAVATPPAAAQSPVILPSPAKPVVAESPASPPPLTPEEIAASKAAVRKRMELRNQMITDLAFHSCSFQYLSFCRDSGGKTEWSVDELDDAIKAEKAQADGIGNDLMKQKMANITLVTNVSNVAKLRVYDALTAMPSNSYRLEYGVGKKDDMKTRCQRVSHLWDSDAPIVSPKKAAPAAASPNGIPPAPRGATFSKPQ